MALVQRRSAAAATERTASRRTAAPADDEGDDEPQTTRPVRRRSAVEPEFTSPKDVDADGDPIEDDEEEAPRSRRTSGGGSDAVGSGWGAAKKLKSEGGAFADEFKFEKEPVLVKFLDDAPFAVYKQHWVEGLRSTGKKSFICLGKGCPLCTIGESASKKWVFNIALIGDDEAECKALVCGSRLFDLIADEHEKKNGIDTGYWALSKSGKKQSTTYKLEFVKERDLDEDWKISVDEAEASLEGLEPYSAEQFKAPSKSYLQEIADELTGGDD